MYWTPSSLESWRAALPLAEFAANQIARSIFLNGSLRQAKAVPDVTVKTAMHSLAEHL